jgi:phosphoribosylformylglycinamidine (FGAM) synthase PurS component
MSVKLYRVNWSVAGTIEVDANNEEEARELIENMSQDEIKNIVLEEAKASFEISSIEDPEYF